MLITKKRPARRGRAGRNTGRDLRRAQIIKRKDGTFTDKSGTLTDDQAHFLTAVADAYRLDLNVLNELDGGAWGEFVEILNKINLSAKSDMFSSFLHETGHLINRWAPEKWAKIEAGFKDYMIAKYGMQRLSYLMDDAIARYDGNISDSAALTEVVCDHLEAIRNTKTFAEDFAKVLGENGYSQSRIKQVFKDIADFFRRMADVIRGWMNGGAKTKAGIFAEQDIEYCEKLAADWLDAMESVRTEYAKYADSANSEVGVRSSEADTGVKKMIVVDNIGRKNVLITDNVFGKSINDYQAVADYIANHIGDSAFSPTIGRDVFIGKDLPGEYTQSKYTKSLLKNNRKLLKIKNLASQNLGEMIEIGNISGWEENKEDKHEFDAKYGWHHLHSSFVIPIFDIKNNITDFQKYNAEMVIRCDEDGKLYLYDIINIEKSASALSAKQKATLHVAYDENIAGTVRTSDNSIPQNGDLSTPDSQKMRPQEQSEVDELRSQLETERAERADYEKKTKAVIREQKKMIEALRSGMVTRSGTIVSFEDTKNVIRGLNERYGVRLSLSDDTSELTFVFILLNKKI